MTTHTVRACVVVGMALLAACGADRNGATRPYDVLSDGRSGGTPGFYFLPPVAREPSGAPANDPGLSPVVEIASLGAAAALLARFEGDAVRESGSHYMVLWSTKQDVPLPGVTYRISVLLDGTVLGFADAQVAKNGKELQLLASNEVFPLTGQRTVPIKFRIRAQQQDPCQGITCAPPTQCQAANACDPTLASCVATAQPAGTACDDANGCTTSDACDGKGSCGGTPVACREATQCEASVACDPAAGACVPTPKGVGTPCDDGSFCTVGDACDGEGGCVAGTASPCAASDPAAGAANAECNPLNRCDPAAAACLYDHLVGTRCTATFNGQPVAGVCTAGATFSVCTRFTPGKISY